MGPPHPSRRRFAPPQDEADVSRDILGLTLAREQARCDALGTRLLGDQAFRWWSGLRGGRDREGEPRIPAVRPVFRVEFLIAFEVDIALPFLADRNDVA